MLDIYKIYESNKCGQFKIINYVNNRSVEIQFIDTGYKTTTQACNIISGNVKDKLFPTIFGVVFIGEGKHKSRVNGKDTKSYVTWKNMLRRCYDAKCQAKKPTYVDCTVTPEWHNFQVFADWFDENYIEGFDLDKDIEIDTNRMYAPAGCSFVRPYDNNEKAHAKHYVFTSPEGETVNIYNLRKFCRDKGLNQGNMWQVAKGKASHHKRWTKTI